MSKDANCKEVLNSCKILHTTINVHPLRTMSKKAEQLSQTPILTQKQVSKANRQDSSKLDATPCSLCEGMGERQR